MKNYSIPILFLPFLLVGLASLAYGEEAAATDRPTDYMIVVTGGEILSGIYADGHVQFLTRTLKPMGCQCVGTLSVGDRRQDLLDALHYASQRVSLIITTGGLGPTNADITRPTLSEFAGIPLKEHPDVLKTMMQRFNVDSPEKLRENLRRQTLIPTQGTYLTNSNGTAVGLVFDDNRRVVVALPGPPRELQPMVTDALIPYLSQRFGIHSIGCSVTMRFIGIGESNIDYIMHKNMQLPDDLMIASQFELGRVDTTFMLPGDTPSDRERLKALENELLGYIGEYFYADDGSTLEDSIIRAMIERKTSLVTVEVGSGGSIAASLNHEENAVKVYSGGYVAPSDAIMRQMLNFPQGNTATLSDNPQTAIEQIARRACEKSASEWAIAVSDFVQDDKGNRSVYLTVGSLSNGFETKTIAVRDHGEIGHTRLVNEALDRLRRQLKK